MQTEPLSQADEQQLNSWLLSDHTPVGTLSLTAVKGYFLALVSSPDPIDVSDWMTGIFAGHADVELAEDKIFALVSVYNDISDQVYGDHGALPPEVEMATVTDDNFNSGQSLHEWSLGFAHGVGFYNEKLMNALPQDQEVSEEYAIAVMTLSFFADREMAQSVVQMQEQPDIDVFAKLMYELCQDIVPGFAQLVEQAALATGLYDDEDADENWE